MNMIIRRAQIKDAAEIVKAEKEIAKEPGYFCSLPSELIEENVRSTIDSRRAIYLVAESEGQLVGHAFLEAFPLHNLKHVAQLTIGIHKNHQDKGIGTQLLEKLIQEARKSGAIEKIELNVRASNTRAIALYKKIGFIEEGRLKRRVKIETHYIDDLVMALHISGSLPHRNISRTGTYGVAREGNKILLVTQSSGTYSGLYDFPGGGIECGETIEQALHREFIEETGIDFESMELLTNMTVARDYPEKGNRPSYTFHQIGLIYKVTGLHQKASRGALDYAWIDINTLNQEQTSPFVWRYLNHDI